MSINIIKKFALSTAMGSGIGMISTSVLIFLLASVLAIGNVPAVLISPVTVFFLAAGALIGGFLSARFFGEKGLLCGAFSGIIFFSAIWIVGFLFDASSTGSGAFIKSAMIIISASIGGIIGVNYIKRK